MGRDDKIYTEACALWRELYGDAPPPSGDGMTLLDAITSSLPVSGYARLNSVHLRPATITEPGRSTR